ncbi:hypothetical protein AB0885_32795, partial [Streptomyces sp. NPDC005534]|uniref:hypothetical protein n=1 Tax=Streptomyces sp. NPDC005534 TaxID=3155714 RepID=UPI00345624B7
LIGAAPGFWGDAQHLRVQGSFGDIGSMELRRRPARKPDRPTPGRRSPARVNPDRTNPGPVRP